MSKIIKITISKESAVAHYTAQYTDVKASILLLMKELEDKDRVDILNNYCVFCGSSDFHLYECCKKEDK